MFEFSIKKVVQVKIRFSAQKNAHFSGFVGLFISFYESKKPFSALFRFFSSCEESFFFFLFTQKANFWFYYQLKRLIYDPEN